MRTGPGGTDDPPVPQGPPPARHGHHQGRHQGVRPDPTGPGRGSGDRSGPPGGRGRPTPPGGPRDPRDPRDPRAAGYAPQPPRATRITTIALVVALVIVVLTAGVLGTLAVLMTRNPDLPLGATPPRRLAVPIHFAPVTGAQQGPCTDPDARPDDLGQVCYTLAAGVSVDAVRRIEAVQDRGGSYSVKIVFAPTFRDQINDLTQETVTQQMAIVVGERVVAAPRVAQVITEDSLSIAGSFTKEQADAMVARLLGAANAQPSATPGTTTPPTTAPITPPATNAPTGQAPQTPAATTGTTTGPTTGPTTGAAAPAAGARGTDPRYPDCASVARAGRGPYFKETHKEYHWYPDKDGDGVACEEGYLQAR
ncbi:SecDF P1 head subdomain-containing protein [Streptosporangium sp. NPDC049376]|uniref:excalibur calcium-binding domain-containing protein n=1 Tax=Streptosporangium sp. NPDC049376 TaxID=3366192 RepID=UPI0037B3A307